MDQTLEPSILEMREVEAGGQYAGLFHTVFISESFLSASTTSHPRSEPNFKSQPFTSCCVVLVTSLTSLSLCPHLLLQAK